MATLRLFASAREAAGVARAEIPAATVDEILVEARQLFGARFADVLATSRIWVNGGPADGATSIADHDVVAVLPPVSGGAHARARVHAQTGADGGNDPDATSAARAENDSSSDPSGSRPHLRLVRSPDDFAGGDDERSPHPSRRTRPGRSAAVGGGPPTSYDALARVPLPDPPAPIAVPWVEADPAYAASDPVAEKEPGSAGSASALSRPPLAVIYTTDRPHGRLGVAWASITGLTLALGALPLAIWLAACAGVAAIQTVRVWVARRERPLGVLSVLLAIGLPLAAASGLAAMNAVLAGALATMLVTRVFSPTKAPIRDVGLSLIIGAAIGLAAASAVYLRTINLGAPMFLLACAAAYDTGAYLVGTGAKSAWEGPVGGVAALLPLTLLAAVALEPPFQGGSPMMLGLVAAVLAPLGPLAASALLGDRSASAPGLRRLDSLLIMGPVWTFWAASLFR